MRLERRRVLSADFSLTASSLVLDGFDQGGDSLAITQQGDSYLFTTDEGWNASDDGALPTGVSVQGETLSVQRTLLDGLSGGLTVVGDGNASLNVTLGEADFSGAAGPLSIVSPTTIGQQPLSLFTAPSDGIRLGVASPGLTVTSLNIAGDLEVTSFGQITDAPGTQIVVSGDATFNSIAGGLDGDFDGNGVVDAADRDHWVANYGLTGVASKYDGDANGDGRVDAADYSLFRDTEGDSISGGITLADQAGDRLEVGGAVTFNAAAEGRHEISIGVKADGLRDGRVELGAISAFGSDIHIIEDAPSDVAEIEANSFTLTSSGKITVQADAEILVQNDAWLTSRFVNYEGDFDGDGEVDNDDRVRWVSGYGTPAGATLRQGDANGDSRIDAADYTVWRDGFDTFDGSADIEGGIVVENGARFEAGGLVRLVARDALNDPATDQPQTEERFEITVNDGATARFGRLLLEGGRAKVVEDAGAFKEARDGNQDGTVIAGIDVEQLTLVSYGPITAEPGANVSVSGGGPNPADAVFASTGSITLADQAGKDVQIVGQATFIAGAGGSDDDASIRVGVEASGVASAAVFNAGGIRFSTLLGEVRIAEDSDTTLLGAPVDPLDPCIPGGSLPVTNLAGSLEIQSAGRIEDLTGSDTAVFFDATFRAGVNVLSGDAPAILLADGENQSLTVAGSATFIDESGQGIQVGGDPTSDAFMSFEAGRLRFDAADGGAVRFVEVGTSILGTWSDASIDLLAGAIPDRSTAGSLELLSSGVILDEPDAVVFVENDASFVAEGTAGVLSGPAIRLANDDTTGSVNRLEIGGTASFVDASFGLRTLVRGIDVGVADDGSPAAATFLADRLRFSSPNGLVRIAEDDATQLAGWTSNGISVLVAAGDPQESLAEDLEIWSARWIADDNDATVIATGDATLIANGDLTGDAIRLADGLDGSNEFRVEGLGTFIAGEDDDANAVTGNVLLGVSDGGSRADAVLDVGSIRFFAEGAEARIADDSATVLAGWTGASFPALSGSLTPLASEASHIEIDSAGSITDSSDAQVFARGADEGVFEPGATAAFVATSQIVLANGEAANRLEIDGLATFISQDGSSIDIGVESSDPPGGDEGVAAGAAFNAGSLRFNTPGGRVRVGEDSGTEIAGWTDASIGVLGTTNSPGLSEAGSLELFASGAITDSSDSHVLIAGDATFVVSAALAEGTPAAIRLADSNSTTEDNTPTNTLTVDGQTTLIVLQEGGAAAGADVGVTESGEAATAVFVSGSIRFAATDRTVRLAEDDSTELAAWVGASIDSLGAIADPDANSAAELQLLTAGRLTDQPDTATSIVGDATLIALGTVEAIRLADGPLANELTVGGTATLISGSTDPTTTPSGSILVGVVSASGAEAEATFDAGALRFYADGGTVRVAEDSSTVLTNWEPSTLPALLPASLPTMSLAQTLELHSDGSITDSPTSEEDSADVVVVITGLGGASDPMANATFDAVEDIVLADEGVANRIEVDGITTLVAGTNRQIDVGVVSSASDDDGSPADATFETGTLRFYTLGGTVRIAEDNNTILTNWEPDTISTLLSVSTSQSTAQTLELLSAGSILDAKNKPTDVSEVAVRVVAPELGDAEATFVAATDITLADEAEASNELLVTNLATFIAGDGRTIAVGVGGDGTAAAAVFNAGSIRFSAPNGTVTIAEDSGTELAGWTGASIDLLGDVTEPASSSADSFQLESNGLITDAEDAVVIIDSDAAFVVAETAEIADGAPGFDVQAIVLADSDGATTNELSIGGFAQFVVFESADSVGAGFAAPKGIDVGVRSDGVPADATFRAGSLRFFAPGALTRLAEDDSTQIGALVAGEDSETSRLKIDARGSITDKFATEVETLTITVDQWAELNANNGQDTGSGEGESQSDIILGDGNVVFRMSGDPSVPGGDRDEPALFDTQRYLAMEASNVSVQVDSAVNIRTSTGSRPQQIEDIATGEVFDSSFSGTYFLTATGDISQVGGDGGSESLTADKVSLASFGAVFVTGLVLKNESEPNLQIVAGESRSLSQAVGGAGGSIGEQFPNQSIPSPGDATFAPILVEIDDESTGQRGPLVQPRGTNLGEENEQRDFGFEDLLVPIDSETARNARISETLADGTSANPDSTTGEESDQLAERTIGESYSAIVVVRGDSTVGDVGDATMTVSEVNDAVLGPRGFEVTSTGNAYLRTIEGDLGFTSANREVKPEATAPSTGVVVQTNGGVFTAVADFELSIDTADGDRPSDTARTSLLGSATGTVSSIVTTTGDDDATIRGPRVLLDPSTEEPNAATTGLVRAESDFEQRITLAVGSRGEDNVLVEVEWADVADIRNDSAANVIDFGETETPRDDFDGLPTLTVPGSTRFADLTQTPIEEIDRLLDADASDLVYEELDSETKNFRVVTIRHNYQSDFLPGNPAQDTLPTTVRVYNDPAINLYDNAIALTNDAEQASASGVRDLNSASFTLAPRIVAVQGGFYLPIESDPPREIVGGEVMAIANDPITAEQQANRDVGRAVVTSNAETLEYGRIDSKGDWIADVPGEEWPQVRDDIEGDFLREVRDRIDSGPYSEGTYMIQIVTPRGEQVLEVWVKGDLGEEDGDIDDEAVWGESEELPDGTAPIEEPELVPEGELIRPISAVEPTTAEGVGEPVHAANAAFAAIAAVGGWRRRLGDAGPFKLDEDGVTFTRTKRRRRRPLD